MSRYCWHYSTLGVLAMMVAVYHFQVVSMIALGGGLVFCSIRARSLAGAFIATAIAAIILIAGARAMWYLPHYYAWKVWLLLLPHPGYAVSECVGEPWGAVVTVVQVVAGIVLLDFFRRPQPLSGTTKNTSVPPPPPGPAGCGGKNS